MYTGTVVEASNFCTINWHEEGGIYMIEHMQQDRLGHARPSLRNRRWVRWLAAVAAAIVVLLIGVGVGSAGSGDTSALNAATRGEAAQRTANSVLRGQVSTLQGRLSVLQGQLTTAQDQAQHAMAIAEAKAKSDYAARNATLSQEASSLSQQQQSVKTELGQLQASQISNSGVYVVGQDIKSGTWHTPGDGGNNDGMPNACYFATLNSTDTTDIADNNNFDGPETVDVSGAYAFEISGPCTWYYTG
jgi:hypothetical protein